MHHWKRRLLALGAIVVGLGVVSLILGFIFSDFLVDLWWFDALGYKFYFWQRLLYRYVVLGGVMLVFFLIFFLNFWVASRFLGAPTSASGDTENQTRKTRKDLVRMFRSGSMRIYTPLSIIMTIPVALPLFQKWEAFLFYVFGAKSGMVDPYYGKDISYYLFSLPIYTLIIRRLLIAFAVLLVALSILYWLEKRFLSKREQAFPKGAQMHLNIIILLLFFIGIWEFILETYILLYNTNHEPLFFGPGFVEMRIILPLIWLTLLLFAATVFSLIYFLNSQKGFKVFAACTVLFALTLGARYSTFLPRMVEKYIVKPNEISYEKPYITYNIKATLDAYKLDKVEYRDFTPEKMSTDTSVPDVRPILRNIPVWDGELLEAVYQQLQQLRTYYTFQDVDVGRYTVQNNYQQVFLSARELDYDQLPAGAHNWINRHLTYTHGYGPVMTPAAQGGGEPMTWFIRGIPPESEFGFEIAQPGIYYGLESYKYCIAPNNAGEINYPKGNDNVIGSYGGKGGVPISSLFRKLIFAFYYKERNIFFTRKTNDRSRILFRRNIVERIRKITPYLLLDEDPYLVVTPQRLYWIQDAYVHSDWYPYSASYQTKAGPINYIRNSVKIVVDAYNGSVDYYIFDPQDPIIKTYNKIYPGLFKDKSEMPSELKEHVRYPRDFFEIQMAIFAKYHQTDPEVYYQQEDMWEFPTTYTYGTGKEAEKTRPYYLTLDLIEPGKLDFLLLVPMIPKGQHNLRALPIVGCDPPYYGRIIVYNFPKGALVYGPSQIYALIDQDTKIASEFTLWNQVGSEVGRGNMIILPVGKVIIYIQPVYLKSSTKVKIPQLQRLIMSDGENVVMKPSLEEAYETLKRLLKNEIQRIEKRFAPAPLTPPATEEPSQQSHSMQPG